MAVRNSNRTGTNRLVYLLGDHLSSASLTADPLDGDKLSELRYKAWGETRYALTSLPTDRRYTGQVEEAGIGLYFFNARWYDSTLGRWAQPDSIVPVQSQGVQAWDRYAFVNNNPLRYTDPTGHRVDEGTGGSAGGCGLPGCEKQEPPNLTEKIMQGDPLALVELLIPSHVGGRIQLEISLDVGIGLSGSAGVNVVYNRNSGELATNVDWALEPGIGVGAGASGTGGLIIGWGSSSVNDVTKGFSGIISGTAAAEGAVAFAITAPVDENRLHIDPFSGQVPTTLYIGAGAGGGYAGIGGGINGPTGLHANLTQFLPWNWNK